MSEGNKLSNIKRCAENMGSCFIHLFIFYNKLYFSVQLIRAEAFRYEKGSV